MSTTAISSPYVTGELTDGEQLPLMRLRYGGSARPVGNSHLRHEQEQLRGPIWLTGTVEDALDLVCDLHVTNA